MTTYAKNNNGNHSFTSYLATGNKAEDYVAKYLQTLNYTVVNVGSQKKVDIQATRKGITTKIEVKQNYNKDGKLWLETVSVAGEGKLNGWMHTSTSDKIAFVSKDFTEILFADFNQLQQAYLLMIKKRDHNDLLVFQPTTQPNEGFNGKEYDSYCYCLPIHTLEDYGVKFTRIDMIKWKADHIAKKNTPKPVTKTKINKFEHIDRNLEWFFNEDK